MAIQNIHWVVTANDVKEYTCTLAILFSYKCPKAVWIMAVTGAKGVWLQELKKPVCISASGATHCS